MASTYLQELTIRLGTGLGKLPEAFRQRHTNYLLAQMKPDGGFGGREGGSDLYYTGFGLRSLAILGELHGEVAESAGNFLRSQLRTRTSIIDLLSLIYGAKLVEASAGIDIFEAADSGWTDNVSRFLNSLRREDGGFAKSSEGFASSTYHTFLVILCLELLEVPVENRDAVIRFLLSRRDDQEGGFREIKASKRAGTNPTAAAIGTLKILQALDEDSVEGTIDLIAEMQTDEGGLRANSRIPLADLLSTFTGLLTLVDLNAENEIRLEHVQRFAESLELQVSGGFQAVSLDPAHDVEYTFYGIGTRALLAELVDP
ncbi:MAG: prenyltransferase/squalene oxidase repeat-containing protein [Planctomycetota bacterium]|nr:prenyltransferase/squalene oxidase repeat-containing protein [Planctomycetota bacterium]